VSLLYSALSEANKEDVMDKAKVGLLPLYLKLYDDVSAEARPRVDAFVKTITGELEKRGLEVIGVPVCRIEKEFEAAVRRIEAAGAHAIVTLHLAYSPSLESAGALSRTRLPVLVLDTTPSFSFGPAVDPEEIMFNHGIHGVQDLCNLLLRNGKPFQVEAGHWERSDVLDRIAALVPSARMAALMGRGKVGLMGASFKGMGDFYTPAAKLRSTVGATVKKITPETLKGLLSAVKPAAVEAEVAEDRARFQIDGVSPEAHSRSVRLGLAIRAWEEQEGLAAFTCNFLDAEKKSGYTTVPFLEASKAMARGVGYAGEGDVLTALLTAAVAAGHPDTTFTEMFCPDWENGTVFLSHMGEMNWRLADGKAVLREMPYKYSATDNPAYLVGRFRPGSIVIVNLAPVTDTGYRLILAPAEMLAVPGKDALAGGVHGWFRPPLPVADFLAAYSRLGGTHHLAMAYTEDTARLELFGRMMGWDTVVMG
jgi:L-arabinose isomerase